MRREDPSRATNPALWSDAFTAVIENTEAFQPNFAQEAREASIVAAKSMIAVTKKLRSSRRMPSLRCHRNVLKSSCSGCDDSCHRLPCPFAHSTSIDVELRVGVAYVTRLPMHGALLWFCDSALCFFLGEQV